jgi:hypothetical protein
MKNYIKKIIQIKIKMKIKEMTIPKIQKNLINSEKSNKTIPISLKEIALIIKFQKKIKKFLL